MLRQAQHDISNTNSLKSAAFCHDVMLSEVEASYIMLVDIITHYQLLITHIWVPVSENIFDCIFFHFFFCQLM